MIDQSAVPAENSQSSARAAGWTDDGDPRGPESPLGSWRALLDRRKAPKWDHFSWLTVRALFESVNDQLAKLDLDLVLERRPRWTAAQRSANANERFGPDFVVDRSGDTRFFLIGDTGEQDASQYAVAPVFTGAANGAEEGRADAVRGDRQRRRLPGRRRQRVRQRVLHPLRGLPEPDLRPAGQPRLVRRPERVHVPLLRRRSAARGALPREQLPAREALPRLALATLVRARAQPARRVAVQPAGLAGRPPRNPARALLRDRHRGPADRLHRHRGHRRDRRRAGRVAAADLAPAAAQGPAHRQADLRRQRVPPVPDQVVARRSQAGVRDRGRRGAAAGVRLPRRDRRRRPQLPALPDPDHRGRGAGSALPGLRRRRRLPQPDPPDPASRIRAAAAGARPGRHPVAGGDGDAARAGRGRRRASAGERSAAIRAGATRWPTRREPRCRACSRC